MAAVQVHTRENNKLVCDLCDNQVETLLSKCVDCDVYMCSICTKAHSRVKLTKDHNVIADQHGPVSASNTKSICQTHPVEDISLYCNTCKTLICTDCILGSHRDHDCIKIRNAATQKQEILSKKLAEITEIRVPYTNSKVKEVIALQHENEVSGQDNVHKISTRIEEFISMVQKIGDKLIQENEKSKEQNKQYLDQIHADLLQELSDIENLNDRCSQVLTRGSDIDKILVEHEVMGKLDEFESQVYETKLHITKFVPGNIDISLLQQTFGSIETEVEQGSDYQENVTEKQTSTNTTGTIMSTNTEAKILSSFKHKSTTVVSICPVIDNTCLIHCSGEKYNDIVDTEGQVHKTVKLDFIVNDFVKTTCGIMATDVNSENIHKLNMDGQKRGTINTAPLYPKSVCLSSDGTILVTLVEKWSHNVNNESRRLVARMTTSGQILETYEYDRGSRLFKAPKDVAENTNRDICVVNRTSTVSGQLVILDCKGSLKVIYEGIMDKAFDPVKVKCDNLGKIIVSDYKFKKIHLLNNEGRFVRYLLTEKDLNYKPWALSVDRQGLLWVGCDDGQLIVVKYLN